MDDTRYKALSEIKKLNKKKGIVAPWQMAPLKGISFKLSRGKADEELVSQLQNECDNVKYYHLIKLTQIGPYDRLYILKSILDFVYPSELIPCHYFQCATEVRFLARRCTEALLKIVNNNFLIPHYPTNSSGVGTEATFEAAIVCNFCAASLVEINRSENILEVLKTRFDSETGVLDLSNFAADKRLIEYCPLFQPRMLLYIMYLSNKLTYVKTINLKNNCIKHITCLDVLKYTKVETIDLTYNQIKNIEDIKGIADPGCLRNLKLEHNPLCSNYENYNYVINVKTLIPNLETLDDVDVTTPSFKKNFVCSPDGQGLAQQFLTHFFTIYDSGNREDLEDFYENNAFFSVNVHVIPFQKNSYSVRLSHYGLKHPFTVQSSAEIMKVFKSFPRTQHDIYTFVCDLLIYTPQYAVLTVGGIFKELNQILGFSRTFVLRYYKGSYTIANDQMSVFNATDYQLEWSFSFPSKVEYFGNPLPYYPEQYEAVGELTQKLCRMNLEYSKMLLEYCDYDVSKALYLFSELYQKNLLPDKAFQQQKGQKDDDDKKKAKYTFFSSILEKSLEDPSKASVKSLWSVVSTSRLQRCEDKVPNAATNIIKIPRSTKPSNLDRYSPTLDDDEDDDTNVAASSTSHITNQTIHHVLNHINSNATVSCDASSDSQAVGMPSIQPIPVTSHIKISVRGDLFSTQSRDPYGISQRIQEIVNAKASPLSNLNNTCSISKRAEEITSSKSVNSDIQSLTVGDQPILQAGSTSAVSPNDGNVDVAKPCAYITIEDDDVPAINNNADRIIEASTPVSDTTLKGNEKENTIEDKITRATDGREANSASTSKSSSQAYCGSQLIEEIIREKEKAAKYAEKVQECESASTESVEKSSEKVQKGESALTESMDKSSDRMSQREIDTLYKKVNKNSFPWLDRNHTIRFKYLLQKKLVNRKLCDIVTDGLQRTQMCKLLDEELTTSRLKKLYCDGFLAKDPVTLEVNAATYLSRVQKDRLQWLLNKELISKHYHTYFSQVHVLAMTSQYLSTDRLKRLFEQGYLMRDPRLLNEDKQNSSTTREVQEEDNNAVHDFRWSKRGRFFQKLVWYLRMPRSDRAVSTCGSKYLKEYIPYRLGEVISAAQHVIRLGTPRVKVLNILRKELLFDKTAELEKALCTRKSGNINNTARKRSINGDDEQRSPKKPRHGEKSPSGSKTPTDIILLEDDDEPGSYENETSLTEKVNHSFTAEELIVVKDLGRKQKHRLKWLLDHNLLGKKYFKYLKPENLSFITKESLTMQRLWLLFTKEWLIRDPAFLADNKNKQNAPVQRSNFSSGIYNKGSIISHSKYCQKLYNYLNMTPQSRADNVNGIKDYLVEYTPYRFNEVICTVKYALANKHRWDEISALLLNEGLMHDLVDLEIKVFGFVQPFTESATTNPSKVISTATEENEAECTLVQDKFDSISTFVEETIGILKTINDKYYSFVEIEDIGAEEYDFDPSLYLKPYFDKPRIRKVTQDKLHLIPYIAYAMYPNNKRSVFKPIEKEQHLEKTCKTNKEIVIENTNEEQIIRDNCRHLNETQKDRIRWLLRHNLLGKKCYTYFKPNHWKHLAAKALSLFRLWHLYGSKKIIRDPGFLFVKNIPLSKQKVLVHAQECIDPVDQYCFYSRHDQFFKKLCRYLMGVRTKKVRYYMLDYAPYRYNDILAAVKSLSPTFAEFPLSEISAILEKGQLIRNAYQFEYDVNKLQTKIKSCNICNSSTNCDQTSDVMENGSRKGQLLSTGLELEEISDEESSVLIKSVLAGIDLEDISDEESPILLKEITNTSVVIPTTEETVIVISDSENSNDSCATSDVISDSNIAEMEKRKREPRNSMQLPETPTLPSEMRCEDLSKPESSLLNVNKDNAVPEARGDSENSKDSKLTSDVISDSNIVEMEKRKREPRNCMQLPETPTLPSEMRCEDLSKSESSLLLNVDENNAVPEAQGDSENSKDSSLTSDVISDSNIVEMEKRKSEQRNSMQLPETPRNVFTLPSEMRCEDLSKPESSLLLNVNQDNAVPEAQGYSENSNDSSLTSDVISDSNIVEMEKRKSEQRNSMQLPETPKNVFTLPSEMRCEDLSKPESSLLLNVNEDNAVPEAQGEIGKFFHLDKDEKLNWLVDNGFLSKNYKSYFHKGIKILEDCNTLFMLWNYFKGGLLIRDPTAMRESERNTDFYKEAGDRLIEVNGTYVYKHDQNLFIRKLEMFVRSKLQYRYRKKLPPSTPLYLSEYIPYRRSEILAFVKVALSEFDWVAIAFALSHIMPQKDVAQLETDLYECLGNASNTGTADGSVCTKAKKTIRDDSVTITKNDLIKFFHLRDKYDKLKWFIDNRLLSKNCLAYFSLAKVQSLLDGDSLFEIWSFFKEGLLIRDPTLAYASEQHGNFIKRQEKHMREVDGNYIYKNEINIFIQKLYQFVCGRLEPQCSAVDVTHLKEYLIEYIPYRPYEVIAFERHELGVFDWTQISTFLADLMHEEDLSRLKTDVGIKNTEMIGNQGTSSSSWKHNYQMQLVPYSRKPWICESIWFDERTSDGKDSLANLNLIRERLSALEKDRLRWLLHKNLISKHFFSYIRWGAIQKLASEAFSMYTLWFLFHSGLLKIDPSFLFENSFTSEQQQAMVFNLIRNNSLQQIGGHYVLKTNRFRSILGCFLGEKLNKTLYAAHLARRRAYLLEYIPSRHYDTAAVIQRYSEKYPLKQLKELLENELGVHFIGELGIIVSELEQIEVLVDALADEVSCTELTNTSGESFSTNEHDEYSSQKADTLEDSRFPNKLRNSEGSLVVNDMQIMPYTVRPWEVSDQTHLVEGSCEKQDALTVQAKSQTADYNIMEEEEISVLRCLNEVQRDRIRWLLEKNLLSRFYYKYFSLVQLRNITCSALTRENLWSSFGFGYLKRDPDFLFKTSQTFDIQPPFLALKTTELGFKRGSLFRRKFHSFLLSALTCPENESSVVRNYVSEYAKHRYVELVKILQYWSLKYPWSELSAVLENKLSLPNVDELEKIVFGTTAFDDIGDKVESLYLKETADKPSHHNLPVNDISRVEENIKIETVNCMQIVPYISPTLGIMKNNEQGFRNTKTGIASAEIDEDNGFQLANETVIHLSELEKDRLRWLLTRKFLNESCYDYFSADQLKFITQNPLTLYVLWFLFEYGYIIRDPGFLFESDIPIERQRELACRLYDKYTTNQFRRKFGTYLGLSIKSEHSSNTALNNHRNYVLEYSPYRHDATISYLKQYRVFTKHPWKKISYTLEKDGVIQDKSDLEIAIFGSKQSPGKQIINSVVLKETVYSDKSRQPFSNMVEDTIEEPKFSETTATTVNKDLHEAPAGKFSEYPLKQKEIPKKRVNKVTKGNARKKQLHKYLESLKKSLTLASLKTMNNEAPLVQETNEEDDVFEEFKALDTSCRTTDASIESKPSRTCVGSLETLETSVEKTSSSLSSAENLTINKFVDEWQVTKRKNVPSSKVESSSTSATENVSLNDTVGEEACNRNKTNKRSKMHRKRKKSFGHLVANSYCEDIGYTVDPTDTLKPGIKSICRLKDSDSVETTDNNEVTIDAEAKYSPIEAIKKCRETLKVTKAEIQDSDQREGSSQQIKQRAQVLKRRRKTKSTSQVEDVDTGVTTNNTVIADVKDSKSEEINSQSEKKSKNKRKSKTKFMDRDNDAEDCSGDTDLTINTAKISSHVDVIEIEDSDPEEIIAIPDEKRSSISRKGRRESGTKPVSWIKDINTEENTDDTVIGNVEDTEINSTRIGKKSESIRKPKSRNSDTNTDDIIKTDTTSTAKLKRDKFKRRKKSMAKTGCSDFEEIIDTPNEEVSSISRRKRIKSVCRIEDISTDGNSDNAIITASTREISSPIKKKFNKGKGNRKIEDFQTDGTTDNSVSVVRKANRQRSSLNAAVGASKKIRKVLIVKIENADKMIRDALSAKRSVNRKSLVSVKASRVIKGSNAKKIPTINIEDTDSEECSAGASNYTKKKCSPSKVRSKKTRSKTDDVTTISSDSTEDTPDIIKEVESFLQSSDMKARKDKRQSGKRERKLNNSSSELSTVDERLDKPEPKAYTLRIRSLDELTGRVSKKRTLDDNQEVASSSKRIRTDIEASTLGMSDEVVVINGVAVSFK